jgi:hypothetical protein
MLYNDAKCDTISRADVEILRKKLVCVALALSYEEKVQLLRFIEGETANERGYDCMVQRHQNG